MADKDFSALGDTKYFDKPDTYIGNVNTVVFIVSNLTVSASEAMINCFKPYMNVKTIGTTTYGKPVGLLPVVLENKYEVWYSSFLLRNTKGQGDCYDGIVPDYVDSNDDPTYHFGELGENYLKKAIAIITPTFAVRKQPDIVIQSSSPNQANTTCLKFSSKLFISEAEYIGMRARN